MGGLTTEEFKNLLEEALEPLRRSIDEVKKSIDTANSNYYQLLTKIYHGYYKPAKRFKGII